MQNPPKNGKINQKTVQRRIHEALFGQYNRLQKYQQDTNAEHYSECAKQVPIKGSGRNIER